MELLTGNMGQIVEILTQVVGVAALVATLTPNESDDKIVGFVLKVVNVLGANVGKASNDPSA
tara:strand:+ start:1542 stop:1727 length:186 start_codon:yes stop_codon:yes gene_type:complete